MALEKQVPSAPPPYSFHPTGNYYPEEPQIGFQTPQQHPGLNVTQFYPSGPYPPPVTQDQPRYAPSPQVVQPNPVNQTVVIIGGCPSCRVGTLESDYTCCGILCAIVFFPIGILCCLCMKQKRCTTCNATF